MKVAKGVSKKAPLKKGWTNCCPLSLHLELRQKGWKGSSLLMMTEPPHDARQVTKQKCRSLGPIGKQRNPTGLSTLSLSVPEKKQTSIWLSIIICFPSQPNKIFSNTYYQMKPTVYFKEKKKPRLILLQVAIL